MGIQGTDRSRCVALGVGENTVNLAHTPIVIRMGMGGIDGLQLQSGLQYFSDHPVGIGTGPLAVDQNALFFTHDNDAGDVKSILRGHKYLCGQLVFSVSNGNGLHKYASFLIFVLMIQLYTLQPQGAINQKLCGIKFSL